MRLGSLALMLLFFIGLMFVGSPTAHAAKTQGTVASPLVAVLQRGIKQSAGRPYSLSIFSSVNILDEKLTIRLLRKIDLGVHNQPLDLLDGADQQLFAVAAMTPGRARQIIALNPETGAERYRLAAGRIPYGTGRPWHKISGDRLLLMTYASNGPKKQRGWSLRAFERLTGTEVYSLYLGRKDIFRVRSRSSSLLIEQRRKDGGGKIDYRVVDAETGELRLLESSSSFFEPNGFLSPDGEHFYKTTRSRVSGRAKKSDARVKKAVSGLLSTLAVYQVSSGELQGTHELGYSLSEVVAGSENGALYAAAQRSLITGGIVVWELKGATVGAARRSSTDCKPNGLYVSRQSDTATVFCREGFEHGALEVDAEVRRGKSTVAPLGFTASADQKTLYVESAKQSCVLKLSVSEMKASRCKKTGSTANRMLAGIAGYSSPLHFTDRSLLLSEETARLYVLNRMAGDITIFDTKRFEKLGTVNLGGYVSSLVPISAPAAGEPPMVLGATERSLVLWKAGAPIKTDAGTDLGSAAASADSPLKPLWQMPEGGRFLALTNKNTLAWYAEKNTLTVFDLLNQTTVFEQNNVNGALAGRILR